MRKIRRGKSSRIIRRKSVGGVRRTAAAACAGNCGAAAAEEKILFLLTFVYSGGVMKRQAGPGVYQAEELANHRQSVVGGPPPTFRFEIIFRRGATHDAPPLLGNPIPN